MLNTPHYLLDERLLLRNLETIDRIRRKTGVKFVLALKCFSVWKLFSLMRDFLDGTTSSSMYETRLGREKFGKEVHAYSVAYSAEDIEEIKTVADKVLFNSVSQLQRFHASVSHLSVGLRLNPRVSCSGFDLADPARRYSRLGVVDPADAEAAAELLNGAMIHCNCENTDFDRFSVLLDVIGTTYEKLLRQLDWVSLGGGISFTHPGYPVDKFCERLEAFRDEFNVQIYLEPGEAVIAGAGSLVVQVLDIVRNEMNIAIVDASAEAHLLDLLIYREQAEVEEGRQAGGHEYAIAGNSCLAGDIFGTGRFQAALKVGDVLRLADAAGYSIVKKNWFNGVRMPSIVVKRLDGSHDVVKTFNYHDYADSMS